MSSPGSVTHWLTALKEGEAGAAQLIWERYYVKLLQLARQKLPAAQRRDADEEDVVQNAFHSFFRGVGDGRFPQLNDRHNLWRLLVIITVRKALDQIDYQQRRKPNRGTLSAAQRIFSIEQDIVLLEQVVGEEPTPEFAAQVAEETQHLLDQLGDLSLQRVAVWKMEGYTNEEIAGKLNCSQRTVARKLDTIRIIWTQEPDHDQGSPHTDAVPSTSD